jgi:hypothetical protein
LDHYFIIILNRVLQFAYLCLLFLLLNYVSSSLVYYFIIESTITNHFYHSSPVKLLILTIFKYSSNINVIIGNLNKFFLSLIIPLLFIILILAIIINNCLIFRLTLNFIFHLEFSIALFHFLEPAKLIVINQS